MDSTLLNTKINSFNKEADVVRENFGDKIARLAVWNAWINFLKQFEVDGQKDGVYDPVGEFDLIYKNDLQKLYGLDLRLPTDVETQLFESITIMNTALLEKMVLANRNYHLSKMLD